MEKRDELLSLCAECGAETRTDEPMSAHTSFRIGGPCAVLVTVPDIPALQRIARFLQEHRLPFRLIGRGSNLLVPDGGFDGAVLKLGGKLAGAVTCGADGKTLRCGAGVSLKDLCMAALERSLTGLEFAYGIPGSVGGAVYMNAGAYLGEISQVLTEVTALIDGEIRTLAAAELDFRYRHSIFMERDWLILEAAFSLQEGEEAKIRARMQELLGKRKDKQPLEFPSAGSMFKRPKEGYASAMIDECGLRGYTVGGAQVSEKHAGFVINRGGASFSDVLALCAHVRETVLAQKGVALDMEPEILRTGDI